MKVNQPTNQLINHFWYKIIRSKIFIFQIKNKQRNWCYIIISLVILYSKQHALKHIIYLSATRWHSNIF